LLIFGCGNGFTDDWHSWTSVDDTTSRYYLSTTRGTLKNMDHILMDNDGIEIEVSDNCEKWCMWYGGVVNSWQHIKFLYMDGFVWFMNGISWWWWWVCYFSG